MGAPQHYLEKPPYSDATIEAIKEMPHYGYFLVDYKYDAQRRALAEFVIHDLRRGDISIIMTSSLVRYGDSYSDWSFAMTVDPEADLSYIEQLYVDIIKKKGRDAATSDSAAV